MPKRIKPISIPGSSKSITLHLRSGRNPVLHFTVDNVPLETTTIQELKEAVQKKVQTTNADKQPMKVPLDKIKILWNRKPVQKKTIAEILGNEPVAHTGDEPEFGVMILGGATVVDVASKRKLAPAAEVETRPEGEVMPDAEGQLGESQPLPAQGKVGDMVLQTAAFWSELQDFLEARVRDESEAARLKDLFKSAWSSAR
jgi:hypothetical protein